MIEKNELRYDHYASTYGWRIKVKSEYDYRKAKSGPMIVEGCSKYMQVPEMKNKHQLLLDCVAMLFERRWVYKSDGIIIYKAQGGILLKPMSWEQSILVFSKDIEQVAIVAKNGFNDRYCLDMIELMMQNYNKGLQRSLPLRIVS